MQITITRGLSELKVLESRINAAISSGTFVAVGRGDQKLPLGHAKSVQQLSTDILASYQQVEDLIKRRENIKRAIIVSNGVTKVSIGGVEMTVAEAIEKKTSINFLKTFHATLNSQLVNANYQVQQQNARVDTDIEKRVMAAYGNDKGKVTPEQHDNIAKAVKSEQAASLIDPRGIEAKTKEVQKTFEDFLHEVDFALSESNAKTSITIE